MNIKNILLSIVILFLVIIILFAFLYFQNNHLETTQYTVSADISTEFRIVHLSDLHGKGFGKNNRKLYQSVLDCQPELIAFTGDLIDDSSINIENAASFLSQLNTQVPVIYISGNHEHRGDKFEEIMTALKSAGITVLINELVEMPIKDNQITILGLDENQGAFRDYYQRQKGKYSYHDYTDLFATLAQHEGFKLLLSHYPENFAAIGNASYQKYDFDLMLAGHAHGGQFRLPLIGPVIAPGQGFFPTYTEGIHGKHPKLIISRGLGNSEFPFRLFNCPEIVEITVTPK
ncbi:MAG: metallophosphoesterase [Clostridiales bacterium]|nr:metallophosphoesterase [Clostridiales bacterium]